MEKQLRKLNLLKDFSFEMNVSSDDLVNCLKKNVELGSPEFPFFTFEALSGGRTDYIGSINKDTFGLRKRHRIFEMNAHLAKATGTILKNEQGIIVEGQVKALPNLFKILFIFLFVIYTIALVITAFISTQNTEALIALPFILIHALFMFGVFYLLLRNSAKKLIRDIERDFHFFTKSIQSSSNN